MKIRILLVFLPGVLVCGCAPVHQGPAHAAQVSMRSSQVSQVSQAPRKPALQRDKKGRYRVMKPWHVELNGQRWTVQPGYTSNGITAPAKVKSMLGDGVTRPETWAAVFHDWLFTQPGITRAKADSTFHELLLAYGVSPSKAQMMYSAVAAYSLSKSIH